MYRSTQSLSATTALLCGVAVAVLFTSPSADAADAEAILEATGIRGGLVVHLGCGDGKLTAALGDSDRFLVQGLDRSKENIAAARKHVQESGLYGRVSISRWEGERLPYVDNLVNLLVVDDAVSPGRDEILRVLAPDGLAYIRKGDQWEKLIKPRPDEMDEWTHYLHDAAGNAVSNDSLVGPPKHLQWVGSPRWARHHDHMASMSAMVTAGNRVFYIFDEGSTKSIMLPSRWSLIARDAFNGVVLWKKPIPRWWTRFHPLKSGPAQFPRRLVTDGQHVYATLSLNGPVLQIDAVTGKTLQTYESTKGTEEILLSDGLLFAMTGPPRSEEEEASRHLFEKTARAPGNPINLKWTNWKRTVVAIRAETGKEAWRLSSTVLPNTLAADGDSVYFHNGTGVVAIDKTTGRRRWASEPVATCKEIPTGYAPTLVVVDGIIVYAGGDKYAQHMKCVIDSMTGLRAKDGKILWTAPHPPSGYQSPEDVLVLGQTIWTPTVTWGHKDLMTGTDLKTGKLRSEFKPDVKDPSWFIHHRCHRGKATQKYLLMSLEGIEFVDPKAKHWQIHHWIRGGCIYGVMPANGLLYAPMHPCACSSEVMLNGLKVVAGEKARRPLDVDTNKGALIKGPAHGQVGDAKDAGSGDWPTYRHNASRNGVASCEAPASVQKSWKTKIGGRLTAPVVAGGTLYVASIDQHTMYALDAATGEKRWAFTAGGRIDSPPTIYKGMVLFGSRDGCVYCLRAADAELVWRFRARRADRRLTAWEQVESVWPIHGSILLRNGEAWFVAGRSVYLDGGLEMYRLKPETGEVIAQTTLDGRAKDGGVLTGAAMKLVVGSPDVLSSVGENVFMRSAIFRPNGDAIEKVAGKTPHLFSPMGFLDDSWFHRSYWLYAPSCSARHSYFRTGQRAPAGRILVCDNKNVFGFGRQKKYFNWTCPMEYHLFREPKPGTVPPAKKGQKRPKASPALWRTEVPILATGLVLAGDTLFAAGAPDVFDETQPGIRDEGPAIIKKIKEQEAALAGLKGGILLAVSKADGTIRSRVDIDAPPVFDGLIAANGRLYLTLTDGAVHCWKGP